MVSLLNAQTNFNLLTHNTLHLPSLCKYFVSVDALADLQQVLALAKQDNLPVLPLGGGSNIVLAGQWLGIVVQYAAADIHVVHEDKSHVLVDVSAGVEWHKWVLYCLERGWHGVENLALIPGSVGAAPIQNIGAYGCEIADVLEYVDYIEIASGRQRRLTSAQCQLAYRDSIFKTALKNSVFITNIGMKLSKSFTPNLTYPILREALLHSKPTAAEVVAAVIAIRQSKLPDPQQLPNAGSFFKNPVVSSSQIDELLSRYPNMPYYPQPNGQAKLAAGWLIEQAGWKGRTMGAVGMHEKQALVLVNHGGASGADVLALAQAVASDVDTLFGVELSIEPVVVGV